MKVQFKLQINLQKTPSVFLAAGKFKMHWEVWGFSDYGYTASTFSSKAPTC